MSTAPPAWLTDLAPDLLDEAVAWLSTACEQGATVAIAAHVGPDGDALGAALALHLALSRRGARTLPTWGEEPQRVPRAYADLPGIDGLVAPSDLPEQLDLLIAVDVASLGRLGSLRGHVERGVPTLVIDHHATNKGFGALDVVAPRAAATVMVVDELLRRLEVPIDQDLATWLYVGLVTDTGRFQHATTDPSAMALGARLLAAGAPHAELTRRLFGTRTLGELRLLGHALGRLVHVPEVALVHTHVTVEDLADADMGLEGTESIIDVVRTAQVAEVALMARQDPDDGSWRVSLRSRGAVDVAELATTFGGGGHTAAAGFTYSGDLDDLVATLVERLRRG